MDPLHIAPISPRSPLNSSNYALDQSGLLTVNALRNPLNLDDIKKSVRINANNLNSQNS